MARGRLPIASAARDVPPVVPWWSWKVGFRDAPLDHPGDKRLLGQAGDWIEPSGSLAAVPTAQADHEFGPSPASSTTTIPDASMGRSTA